MPIGPTCDPLKRESQDEPCCSCLNRTCSSSYGMRRRNACVGDGPTFIRDPCRMRVASGRLPREAPTSCRADRRFLGRYRDWLRTYASRMAGLQPNGPFRGLGRCLWPSIGMGRGPPDGQAATGLAASPPTYIPNSTDGGVGAGTGGRCGRRRRSLLTGIPASVRAYRKDPTQIFRASPFLPLSRAVRDDFP